MPAVVHLNMLMPVVAGHESAVSIPKTSMLAAPALLLSSSLVKTDNNTCLTNSELVLLTRFSIANLITFLAQTLFFQQKKLFIVNY